MDDQNDNQATEGVKVETQGNRLTAADLYAPSSPTEEPLVYEETPIIEPIPPDVPQGSPAPSTKPVKPKTSGTGILIKTALFIVLFGLGMAASMALRSIVPGDLDFSFFAKKESTPTPVPTRSSIEDVKETPKENEITGAVIGWKHYPIVSGSTRLPITDVSFALPPGVAAPTCDGGSCASQGTDLPGGTRLTIAPRGNGQVLADIRGKILTDATGREFTMKEATMAGVTVTEFVANFAGSTGGGFSFSKMRGVMIPISGDLMIEMNHFAPSGKIVDFAKDDELFDQIVASFISATKK